MIPILVIHYGTNIIIFLLLKDLLLCYALVSSGQHKAHTTHQIQSFFSILNITKREHLNTFWRNWTLSYYCYRVISPLIYRQLNFLFWCRSDHSIYTNSALQYVSSIIFCKTYMLNAPVIQLWYSGSSGKFTCAEQWNERLQSTGSTEHFLCTKV